MSTNKLQSQSPSQNQSYQASSFKPAKHENFKMWSNFQNNKHNLFLSYNNSTACDKSTKPTHIGVGV